MTRLLILSMSVLAMAACTPTAATRGNFVDPDDLAQLKVGASNKSTVRNVLGSPTTTAPMNDNVWYYIGSKTERFGWRREKPVESRTLTLTFNEEGILETLTPEDNQGKDIAMVKDITPTHGTEMTVFQQFFGNLGKFNTDNRDQSVGPQDVNN